MDNLISGGPAAEILNARQARFFRGGGGNDTFNVRKGGGSDSIADFAAGPGAAMWFVSTAMH